MSGVVKSSVRIWKYLDRVVLMVVIVIIVVVEEVVVDEVGVMVVDVVDFGCNINSKVMINSVEYVGNSKLCCIRIFELRYW